MAGRSGAQVDCATADSASAPGHLDREYPTVWEAIQGSHVAKRSGPRTACTDSAAKADRAGLPTTAGSTSLAGIEGSPTTVCEAHSRGRWSDQGASHDHCVLSTNSALSEIGPKSGLARSVQFAYNENVAVQLRERM